MFMIAMNIWKFLEIPEASVYLMAETESSRYPFNEVCILAPNPNLLQIGVVPSWKKYDPSKSLAQLPWHDWIIRRESRTTNIFSRSELWADINLLWVGCQINVSSTATRMTGWTILKETKIQENNDLFIRLMSRVTGQYNRQRVEWCLWNWLDHKAWLYWLIKRRLFIKPYASCFSTASGITSLTYTTDKDYF